MSYRKINPEIIAEIKKCGDKMPHRELAQKFVVSQTTVFKIFNGSYGKKIKKKKVAENMFDSSKKDWFI